MYINCSECQKQFLYTTCSPHVLQKEELLKKNLPVIKRFCYWAERYNKYVNIIDFKIVSHRIFVLYMLTSFVQIEKKKNKKLP